MIIPTELQGVLDINPLIISGAIRFKGTRVPVQDLWDYLAGGETLDSFLDSFPSVSREMAVKVIEIAAERLLEGLPAR